MPLRKLREISFTNNLNDEVSDLVIVYCESNKSIRDWFNTGDVDVETLKNVLWSRQVAFPERILSSSATYKTSAEHIWFGENDGYWQLYFTFKGDMHRLEKNNFKMTLSPECDQHDLKITLWTTLNGVMNANFQVNSVEADFKVVRGKPAARGVKVWIRNQLGKDIDFINVVISEDQAPNKCSLTHSIDIEFDKKSITADGIISSSERITYNSLGCKHYLKMFFKCEGSYYEIISENYRGVQVQLTEKDQGSSMDLDICGCASKSEIYVKVKTNAGEMELLPSKSENINSRKTRINQTVANIKKCCILKSCANDLLSALRDLASNAFGGEDNLSKAWLLAEENTSKLFQPSLQPKLPFDEMELDGKMLKITICLSKSYKKMHLDFKNVVKNLDSLKSEWNDLIDLLKYLGDLLGTVDLEEDKELAGFKDDLRMIQSMHTIDALCKILIPSGLDEKGLTFFTSKCETAREISVDPGRLMSAIEEEMQLWDGSVFSVENKCSKSSVKKIEDDKKELKTLIIYQNILIRTSELFVLIRIELVDILRKIASTLPNHNNLVNYGMMTSSSIGVVGAGFTFTGLALAPFTAGLSLAMLASGLGAGITSGALGIGTALVDGYITQSFLDSTVSLAANDQFTCNLLSQLQPLIVKQNNLLQNSKVFLNFPEAKDNSYFKIKAAADSTTSTLSNAGIVAVKTGVEVAKTAAFRIGSFVVGVVFDLTVLASKMKNLSKGGYSELCYKLESDALLLDQELEECISGLLHLKCSIVSDKEDLKIINSYLSNSL